MEFYLRPWRESDAESIARYAADWEVARNLRDVFPHPYALADARDYIASCLSQGEEDRLCRAIEADGEAVGSIGVFVGKDVYRKSAELGYWLAKPYWGRGIMSAAVRQMTCMAFERFDIVRVYAEPYARNAGSRRVLEKAGFVLEGTLRRSVFKGGELLDSCVYARLREEE
ncbi:GNAT family N-acetyltransferase [Feifania hominis]|uniref:GNAT family N-acetyltransferase n=1 Tax=Feifania hominis TaxID=2763660 RepID=A0A926DC27_9FIRM|nr:GNAT family N-acetyltransferase [Feifania hominis]